ncbi:MAG TPA: ABC transporter ATP-binding protein, partial [Hyphomicrobium sp.]|nr:ABC transporter ATP-binding protein [Hyphomicrobium sp.]
DGTIDELRRIAKLPAKVRFSVTHGGTERLRDLIGAAATTGIFNGHRAEFDVTPSQKIEVLRRAATAGDLIDDIDVIPPSLDELYAHFLRGGAA